MSSGAFFPASLILKAAEARANNIVQGWKDDREAEIQSWMEKKRWVVWPPGRVKMNRAEAEAAAIEFGLVGSYNYFIKNPMESKPYATSMQLASMAKEVMGLDEEATMFVSARDFHTIRKFYAKSEVKEIIA